MKSTMCVFVRDLATRRIVHHEIEEIDAADMPSADRTKSQGERVSELMKQYPPSQFDVFLQGFDTLSALYGSWPELDPGAAT